MKHLFLLIFCILTVATSAQAGSADSVVVKGHIQSFSKKDFSSQKFKIEFIDDFITFKRKVITQGVTGNHGDFSIKFPAATTGFYFLSFAKVERTFYATPGKSYYIEISAPIEQLKKHHGSFGKDVKPGRITNKHAQELNFLIDTLDYACSNFLQNNVTGRRSKAGVDEFVLDLKDEFSDVKPSYFHEYLNYKEAELLLFIYRNKRKEFADLYFNTQNNLAAHIQKMQVFRSYYKGNLKFTLLLDDKSKFHAAFRQGELQKCLSLITDVPSANRELRELLLLHGIYEVHSTKYYSIPSIHLVLDELIRTSKNIIHREIAQNIKDKITTLKEGYQAPNIVIEGVNNSFDLNEHKNKYVYLCFFRTWDESFVDELKLLEIVAKKYADELQIVCIAVDNDLKKFHALKNAHQGDWLFLHYSFQTSILGDYAIEEFRMDRYDQTSAAKYYLIGPEGNFVFSPAISPTKGFHKDFQRIIGQ